MSQQVSICEGNDSACSKGYAHAHIPAPPFLMCKIEFKAYWFPEASLKAPSFPNMMI